MTTSEKARETRARRIAERRERLRQYQVDCEAVRAALMKVVSDPTASSETVVEAIKLLERFLPCQGRW